MCKQQIISGTAPVSLSHTQESDGEFMGGGDTQTNPKTRKNKLFTIKTLNFLYQFHMKKYMNSIALLTMLEKFNDNQQQKYKNSFFKYLKNSKQIANKLYNFFFTRRYKMFDIDFNRQRKKEITETQSKIIHSGW